MPIPSVPSPLTTILATGTYDSNWFPGSTVEIQVQNAIDAAANDGAPRVLVHGPYDANLVDFNNAVRMVREGGNWDEFDAVAYGAKADAGITNNTTAFQAAFTAAAAAHSKVIIPETTSWYGCTGTILYTEKAAFLGRGVLGPIIKQMTSGQALFQFVGTSEGASLNASFSNLQLTMNVSGTGCAIRARNFQNLDIDHVTIVNFKQGVWADWGNGLYIDRCQFILNERGIQLGGNLSGGTPTPAAGIRGIASPWMDNVRITSTAFSSNKIDINDMGSVTALGGLVIENCTVFEGAAVTGKTSMIHIAGRKAYRVSNCWIEGQVAARSSIRLSNVDYDGNTITPFYGGVGAAYGGRIEANHFLSNSADVATIGIEVIRGKVTIEDNVFEFGPGSTPIKLTDATTASHVGLNTYLTYADALAYTGPILLPAGAGGAGGHHIIPTKADFVALTYSTNIDTDPAIGAVYQIVVTDGVAFTIRNTSSQGLNTISAGRAGILTYEIHNASGGAMGAITWGSNFLLAGAFTNPANGKKRVISFYWNGTGGSWIELSRLAADM